MHGLLIATGVGVVISGCTWMYLHNGEIREVAAMGTTMVCMLVYLYLLDTSMVMLLFAVGFWTVASAGTWMYLHNEKIHEAIVVCITTTFMLLFFYLLHKLKG